MGQMPASDWCRQCLSSWPFHTPEPEIFLLPIVHPPATKRWCQLFPILTNPSLPPPPPAAPSNRKIMTYIRFSNFKIRTYINFPKRKISTYNSQKSSGLPKNHYFSRMFYLCFAILSSCFTHVLPHFLHLLLYFVRHLPTKPNR
jgi:hypothetical protein